MTADQFKHLLESVLTYADDVSIEEVEDQEDDSFTEYVVSMNFLGHLISDHFHVQRGFWYCDNGNGHIVKRPIHCWAWTSIMLADQLTKRNASAKGL